uniref:WGS project CAEQ00000000 data, annotated contig 1337 n=1 Tax=Trypanosoma congolense (strain IL3000) TaxID=1068625 RepID=F9W5K5_TRYCI|nr:unnamed protein product [Trypanosoma congolense IL3000]
MGMETTENPTDHETQANGTLHQVQSQSPPRPNALPALMESLRPLDSVVAYLAKGPSLPCNSRKNFSWKEFKRNFYFPEDTLPAGVMNDKELRSILQELSTRTRPSCCACRPHASELQLVELLTGVKGEQSLTRTVREHLYEEPRGGTVLPHI